MIKDIPVFTISLDFELYWGIFDKVPLDNRLEYFAKTRSVIPEILTLFETKEVHVTWATVGMLFAKSWEEWSSMAPTKQPLYKNNQLSAYRLKSEFENSKDLDYCFFAPELIEGIIKTPYQELASHTFTHYYCREQGQTQEQFRADIKAFKIAADKKGITANSLVFPRNQYSEHYMRVCWEEGIKIIRSNPQDWFWRHDVKEGIIKKIFRTGDAYLQLGGRTSYPLSLLKLEENMPLAIPASRFLRPVHGSKKVLNKLRLNRIIDEMTVAAKRNECYHLWWHPHNFGNYPEQSMTDLQVIINHYKSLQEQYGMQSMSMLEVYEYVSK